MFACGLSTAFPRSVLFNPESLGGWRRDSVRVVDIIVGCFLLTPVVVWQSLGGFDDRFFMYGEDVDLCLRSWKKGYRPVICPDARLIHELGQSAETPIHKAFLVFRGKATLVHVHWRGVRRWLGIRLLVAGVGIRAALGNMRKAPAGLGPGARWRRLWNERGSWMNGYPPSQRSENRNQR